MINILILAFTLIIPGEMVLYDFKSGVEPTAWVIVDDNVMGGMSEGTMYVDENGYGIFSGDVSLKNNGGFSSVRYRFDPIDISSYNKCLLYIKGDGKRYQFRVKTNSYDRQSYIAYFNTSGKEEVIEIVLREMYPTFRGMKLQMPDFPGIEIEEISFLIGNSKEESFSLAIDRIVLK